MCLYIGELGEERAAETKSASTSQLELGERAGGVWARWEYRC